MGCHSDGRQKVPERQVDGLHRRTIKTGFLLKIQRALSPNHKHTSLACYAFNMARSMISGSNHRNKQAIKVTRKS